MQLVKHVISAQWIPIKRLKYLYVSLNNIAVILNRKKRPKEVLLGFFFSSLLIVFHSPGFFNFVSLSAEIST